MKSLILFLVSIVLCGCAHTRPGCYVRVDNEKNKNNWSVVSWTTSDIISKRSCFLGTYTPYDPEHVTSMKIWWEE